MNLLCTFNTASADDINTSIPVDSLLHDFSHPPQWAPLETFTTDYELRSLTMYMYRERRIGDNEALLYVYKHCMTRRYLFLDAQGKAYKVEDGHYVPCDKNVALRRLTSRDGIATTTHWR